MGFISKSETGFGCNSSPALLVSHAARQTKQLDSARENINLLQTTRSHKMSAVEVEGELEALKKAKLVVLKKRGDVVDVKISPKDDVKDVKYTRTDGKIEVEFMAKVPGPLTAEVQVNGNYSKNPLVMNVKPQQIRITGEFKTKNMSTGSVSLKGIAVNNDNSRIAVADDSSHCVKVFNSDGDLLLKYIKFYRPQGLAFANERDLVIADNNNHRICILNTTLGKIIKTFGNQGNGNGQFYHPHGVHVDEDGNIIVNDYSNHRVQVFTRDGHYQYQFGLTEQDNFGPVSTVTHGERFYVSDSCNHVIHVFEKKDGVPTRISKIGKKGEADGQFRRIWGLAIDNDHHLLVCDRGNNRIQKFTLDGRFVGKTYDEIKEPNYVTVLEDEQLLITSYHSGVFCMRFS